MNDFFTRLTASVVISIFFIAIVPTSAFAATLTCASDAITCFEVTSKSTGAQVTLPITLGQPFKSGDWNPSTHSLYGKIGSTEVTLQTNDVSSHVDGTARFAVLSTVLSNVSAGQSRVVNIYKKAKLAEVPQIIPASPDWQLTLEAIIVEGSTNALYVAEPQALLEAQIKSGEGRRFQGAVATEYTVVASFKNKNTGAVHPHLTARLHVRLYENGTRILTDVVLENTRTFTENPSNLTYSLVIKQAGQIVHTQPQITHYHHARWHNALWRGTPSQYIVRHNMSYFIASGATWNYDLNLDIPESTIAAEARGITVANSAPMQSAQLATYFPGTGGRPEIAPLPEWVAMYIITQDERLLKNIFANADAAAGVGSHYRDENTGQPLSVIKYPNITINYDWSEPKIPKATGSSIWSPDISHQGSFAYIPYMLTGDAFYLDEALFWASWNVAIHNPGAEYRQFDKCLLVSEQIRGQAWGLRSLAEAAFALPDTHPQKAEANTILRNNMDWFLEHYGKTNKQRLSPLGAIRSGYNDGDNAPWQADFMSTVMSWLSENKQPKAKEVLTSISRFQVGRFLAEPQGFCTARAAGYWWDVEDAQNNFITTWSDLYKRNNTDVANLPCSDSAVTVEGYPDWSGGYAAVARAALASAANAGIPEAITAYNRWLTFTPKLGADFKNSPSYAIVPRSGASTVTPAPLPTPVPTPAPVVMPTVTLTAIPASVTSGQSTVVTWSSTNATTCTGTNFTTSGATSGSISVALVSNATFTLSCTGTNGSITKTTDVVVSTVASTKFKSGDRVSATFNLNIRTTPNTSGVLLGTQLSNAIGAISSGPTLVDGFNWWNINFDNGADGWAIEDYLVKSMVVTPTPNPVPSSAPIITLVANKTTALSRERVTISWSAQNATRCTSSNFLVRKTKGVKVVRPVATTSYTITCTGKGGSATQSVVVTVTATEAIAPMPVPDQAPVSTPVPVSDPTPVSTPAPAPVRLENTPANQLVYLPFEGSAVSVLGGKETEVIGSVNYQEGKVGKAAYFDGTSYVNIKIGTFKSPYTVSFWMKPELPTAERQIYTPISGGRSGGCVFTPYVGYTNVGIIRVHTGGCDETQTDISGYGATQWHHVTVVMDGATRKVYVNGALKDEKADINSRSIPSWGCMFVGARQEGDCYAPYDFYKGLVDEVRVFTRALSESEIRSLSTDTTIYAVTTKNAQTPALVRAMKVSTIPFTQNLALASNGEAVVRLQKVLAVLGYFKEETTGYYGAMTASAVAAFQKDNGLESIGNVGPMTRSVLNLR